MRAPAGRVSRSTRCRGGPLDRDALPSLRIQFVQSCVQHSGVCVRTSRHPNTLRSRTGVVPPEVRSADLAATVSHPPPAGAEPADCSGARACRAKDARRRRHRSRAGSHRTGSCRAAARPARDRPATPRSIRSPTSVGPPSSTSKSSPKAVRTCSAVVGESCVKRFALGAAIGTPDSRISANATGCAGMRIPTVGNPAVTSSGTVDRFGSTRVNGPGQCFAVNSAASDGHSDTSSRAIASESTCTISGLVEGRP
jgi:hypothetical protein